MKISVICLLELSSNTAFWSVKQMVSWILSGLQRRTLLNTPLWGTLPYMQFSSCYFFSILKGGYKIFPPFLAIGWKCWCMQSSEDQVETDQLKQGLWAKWDNDVLYFHNLFFLLFELCNGSWYRKWKVQNPPKIQREGFFSFTSCISGCITPIYLPSWLARFPYLAHDLTFHCISNLFQCLVTQLQLCSSVSHRSCFFPSKLIILKSSTAYLEGLLLLRIIYFIFLQGRFCPLLCNAKHVCTAAADTRLGPAWGKSRSLRKDQPVELAGFIGCTATPCSYSWTFCCTSSCCAGLHGPPPCPACAWTEVSASLSSILREGFLNPWASSFGPTMLSLCCLSWCYCSASVHSKLLKGLSWNKKYFCPC